MKEEWKDIKGYEGFYQVSNYGMVRSVDRFTNRDGGAQFRKGQLLSPGKDRWGYRFVILQNRTKKCKMIHRLVSAAFLDPIPGKPIVNHIDGNKSNNAVDNLEYCTQSENMRHAFATGLHKTTAVLALDKDTEDTVFQFSSVKDARKMFAPGTNISNCLNGRCKTAYGYKWRYAD